MVENTSREPGLAHRRERGRCGGPRGRLEVGWAELMPPGWRGRVSELSEEALRGCWKEAVGYARWEIGQYGRWRELKEPVLADGYDAEGVVQGAFERLLYREAGSDPNLYSAEAIRRELRVLLKHRVRWLHERSETRLVVGEWEVMAARPDGELVSIFDYLPGRLEQPDEALMRKEKEQLLGEFKAGFEGTIKQGRQDLVEVFRRVWEGQKRREIAQGGPAAAIRKRSECSRPKAEGGGPTERVKALEAQLRRRLARFGAGARGGVAEMLEGMKEGG